MLDREETRREVLPAAIELLTERVGPAVSMYRAETGVVLRVLQKNGAGLAYVHLWDDRAHYRGSDSRELNLLNVVPLCQADSGCTLGCGCRCSHDLGYSRTFQLAFYPEGGEVYVCHSKHIEKPSRATSVRPTSRLNVTKMMADLKVELEKLPK